MQLKYAICFLLAPDIQGEGVWEKAWGSGDLDLSPISPSHWLCDPKPVSPSLGLSFLICKKNSSFVLQFPATTGHSVKLNPGKGCI